MKDETKKATPIEALEKLWNLVAGKEEGMKNKVKTNKFEYEETVKEFTGLIFHCPKCDEVFHLHIATVNVGDEK